MGTTCSHYSTGKCLVFLVTGLSGFVLWQEFCVTVEIRELTLLGPSCPARTPCSGPRAFLICAGPPAHAMDGPNTGSAESGEVTSFSQGAGNDGFKKRSRKALAHSLWWKAAGPSAAPSPPLCSEGHQGSKGGGLDIAVTCKTGALQTSFFSALPTEASLVFLRVQASFEPGMLACRCAVRTWTGCLPRLGHGGLPQVMLRDPPVWGPGHCTVLHALQRCSKEESKSSPGA